MAWRIIRRLAIYSILFLLVLLVFSFFFVATVDAVSLTLSPTYGYVYDHVNLSGEVPPDYNWEVSFDINGDGTFSSNELVVSENAGSSSVLSSYFVVPPCEGSDNGVVHAVKLSTDYPPTYTPEPPAMSLYVSAAPYDRPYSATKDFTVYTYRTFTILPSGQAGASIPIRLTITGGSATTTYEYRVEVTKPDGTVATFTFTATTNTLGLASAATSYQDTNIAGTYKIVIHEISPLDSFEYSTNVQVDESPSAYSQPAASISSIQPNPATAGATVTFEGSGSASSGYSITAYRWTSDVSGIIGSTSTFTIDTLPVGTHTITLEVQDSNNVWSIPVSATLVIEPFSDSVTPPPSDDDPGSSGSQDDTPNGDGNNGNPTNQVPTARLTSTPPTQITQGQSVILTGDATDPDGTIVGYSWISDISGLVSTGSQLDTANLSAGTHHISFQAVDNDGGVSNAVEVVLTVTGQSAFLPLLYFGASVGAGVAVSMGVATVWLHYSRPTSVRLKRELTQKNAQENVQEENQDKKDEKRSKKRTRLIFSDFKIPTNIMKDTGYSAQFKIRNVGTQKATNITINALNNPFFDFKEPSEKIADLSPGQSVTVTMPFTTNSEIGKNIYQQQFELKSKQTSLKTKKYFMRGGRIAVLTDAEANSMAEPVMTWLKENQYPFEEIHNAAHLMTQLYQYDLLIVSASHDMPSKWVQNLCTFVENGQSILLIDKIHTTNPQRLTDALGYAEAPNPVSYDQAALEICKQHPITEGLPLGKSIPLGPCTGNAAKFTDTSAPVTVVANSINQHSEKIAVQSIAAVMVKEDGKGKFVHLNFQAQEHLNQIDRLLKNSVEWLLWD